MALTVRSSAVALAGAAAVAAAQLPATATVTAPGLVTVVVTYAAPPSDTDVEVLSALAPAVHAFTHVPAAVVRLDPAGLPLLRGLPGVRAVYPNQTLRLLTTAAQRAARVDAAWADYGVSGAGVGIAVIDAGVDGAHPDLCARPELCRGTPVKTVQNVKVLGRQDVAESPVGYLEDQVSTDSSSGHGSHVASIAAGAGTASEVPGRYRGVAHGASIVGYGTGEAVEAVNVLAAYDHALRNRDRYNIRVINNSWGPGAFTDYDPEHPVNRATDAAVALGVNVVFGAGNDGTRTDSQNMFSANPNAISAGGGTAAGHQAFFSSRGVPGSPLWHPTVTAPGEAIVAARATTGFTMYAADASGVGGPDVPATGSADSVYYASSSGTSMAAPHVSGIVALMQQAAHDARGVWLTPQQVRNILQNTARPMLPAYQHYSVGAGYVDARAAVAAAVAGTMTQPYDDGTAYEVEPFSGTVGPAAVVATSSFTATHEVRPGAVSLEVMADWGPELVLAANTDVDLELVRPDGRMFDRTFLRCDPARQPNGYSSFCSSAPNERLTVAAPEPGVWTVRVYGGLAEVSDTVRGLWSVAYPDGTPVLNAPVAAVSVSAATPASVTGQLVALSATALDAAGRPVPNLPVEWTSTGPGGVVGREPVTDAQGRAAAAALSGAPGVQTVTARVGGLSAVVSVTWPGVVLPSCVLGCPPPNTAGKAAGGGWFLADGNRHHVAVSAEYAAGGVSPAGSLRYDDKAGTTVSADVVESFTVSGSTATLRGPAVVNGQSGYRYELVVSDVAEPGRDADTVRLVVTGGPLGAVRLDAGGRLDGGNLQVRAG